MKPVFPDVVGNGVLRQQVSNDLLAQKLSHAYLIEGAKGSGKHMIAYRIAAALSCERRDEQGVPLPCMTCPSCRKILSGNSPDVLRITREDKATMGIEVIRELKRDVWIAPNELDFKIYIVEDAHTMTTQAQNSFLLTLEEPPAYVLFLLLTENAASLLETVRSRAPTLRTEPLTTEQIDEYLSKHSSDGARLKKADPLEYFEIVAAANGNIGRALDLLDPNARKPILTQRANAREFVRLCSARKSSSATLKFLMGIEQKREEIIAQMRIIQYCLRDLLVCKQTDAAPLCFFADREEAAALAYEFTTPELLTLCNRLEEAVSSLQMNANVRLTLTTMAVNAGLL